MGKRITPAYAGNTCFSSILLRLLWDHPRIRGEHFLRPSFTSHITGSPPHTRGTHHLIFQYLVTNRITPAYAGNTSRKNLKKSRHWDHPRIRGEHFIYQDPLRVLKRITPAYAGNTKTGNLKRSLIQDHPRIRGEHFLQVYCILFPLGSPPHTRGTLNNFVKDRKRRRITPAYAGNTFKSKFTGKVAEDHPRIRGEHL